jgi:hypothetical protein
MKSMPSKTSPAMLGNVVATVVRVMLVLTVLVWPVSDGAPKPQVICCGIVPQLNVTTPLNPKVLDKERFVDHEPPLDTVPDAWSTARLKSGVPAGGMVIGNGSAVVAV